MNIKRILLGLAVVMVSGIALAQTTLPPFLSGTSSEHRREVFEVGMLRLPVANNALTALAGGAQVGTPLNLGFNRFTTVVTAGDSAQLPTISGAVLIYVVNATATSMNVFPPTGGIINALSANAAFALAAGKSAVFMQGVDTGGATIWYVNLTA